MSGTWSADGRRLTGTLIVLVLAAVSMSVVVAACGGGGGTAGTAEKETPVIVLRPYAPVSSWDPALEYVDDAVLGNIYERLTYYDADTQKVVPDLATEWTSSKDGKTWTFKIRKGVKFHDGTEVDAQAVKFSIERTRDTTGGMGYLWASVKRIDTPDNYTVVFHLSYPQPLDLISAANVGAFIYSPTAVKSHGTGWLAQGNDAGSGPYVLKSQEAGSEADLARFPDYWRGWEGKHAYGGIYRYVEEPSSRSASMLSGDGTLTTDVPIDDVKSLKAAPSLRVYTTGAYIDTFAEFIMTNKYMKNLLVRQALNYATPFSEVIQAARGGYAVQSYGPTVKGLWGYEQEKAAVTQFTYDPNKARSLLAQAGYPKGFKIQMSYISGEDETAAICQVLQQAWGAVGVQVDVRPVNLSALAQFNDPNTPYAVVVAKWWPTFASPYDEMYNICHSGSSYNWSNVPDPTLDKLIDDANVLSATDRTAAADKFAQAAKLCVEQCRLVWLYDEQSIVVTDKSLQGFSGFNPMYNLGLKLYDVWLH